MRLFYSCLFLLALGFLSEVSAQSRGTIMEFGKNRVQYKDFDWFYYRSPNFDTYYYRDGKELAATVGKLAEQNLKEIENFLDYKFEGRIQILSYNKYSDIKQTNLGLQTDFTFNTGGLTQIIGTKIFVYFNGNTEDLRKQIRAGIAQVLINQLLFGGNIQEMMQSSTLLTLPEWFIPGLISYISEDWNIGLDNYLKDCILSGKFKKLNRLIDNDALIAGHSIWKYVVDNYGTASISNILYMTRVNRNAESGFQYIIGLGFADLSIQWIDYYKNYYKNADDNKIFPAEKRFIHKNKKKGKKLIYSQFKLSPNGHTYAYIINDGGRSKVFTSDLITGKTKKVFAFDHRTSSGISENFDAKLNWHPSGMLLAVAYDKKSMPVIQVINITDKKENEEIKMYKYDKIVNFSYSSTGRKWALSAIKKGQSDIFVFDIPSRRDEQITNDWFDDLDPRFIQNSSKIIFASNRNIDSLISPKFSALSNLNNLDLWVYDYLKRDAVLQRVTHTPFANESNPLESDSNHVLYLSDANGINNLYSVKFDTVLAYKKDTTIGWLDTTISVYRDTFSHHPLSNFARNIELFDYNSKTKKGTEVFFKEGQFHLLNYINKNSETDSLVLGNTSFSAKKKRIGEVFILKEKEKAQHRQDTLNIKTEKLTKKDSSKIDINNYFFQSEINSKRRNVIPIKEGSTTSEGTKKAVEPKKIGLNDYFNKTPSPYIRIFSTNSLIAQLDNSLINNDYQLFTGSGPISFNQQINAMIKVASSDLMEDYRFVGGFRAAPTITVPFPEYFLSFENLKTRLDKQIIYYHQTQTFSIEGAPYYIRTNMNEVKTVLKYPFSESASLRFHTSFRRDDITPLATDTLIMRVPPDHTTRIGYKLEYVFDNSINKGLNLLEGTRYKVYLEQSKEAGNKNSTMTNIGFDFRNYKKIHRQIILASRIAGATSIGESKVIYYLGGVDNWWFVQFNDKTQIDFHRNYYYQALATNMRGFSQNVRNGNSFTVINTEIRFPVFSYFSKQPIKSDFLKNFQIVPFGDIGSAWVDWNPYTMANRQNQITNIKGPIKVTIIEPRYPIVAAFGFGLRSRIFGYFLRYDFSFGIENGYLQPRIDYFSTSLDF